MKPSRDIGHKLRYDELDPWTKPSLAAVSRPDYSMGYGVPDHPQL